MRLFALLVLVAAVAAATTAPTGTAHSAQVAGIPKPHKLWSMVKDKWFDPPPGAPDMGCDEARAADPERKRVRVFDPKLGAWVEWECRCPFPRSCAWFRLRIVPDALSPFWLEQPRLRWTREWHRACRAVVCKRKRVTHYYPTLFAQGGRL